MGRLVDRTILHCDCNSFFASVEQSLNPELAKVPMSVAGDPTKRHGIILANNQLAKAAGVKTAGTVWQAKQKCPNLVCVPPHYELYQEYSVKCNEIYYRYTDLIEPFGIDESWLDVTASTHLFGSGEKIADELRATIKQELGLTISVGVSFNKVFAKLGSDYKKPDATTVITRETGKKIVFPLPVSDLLFVGRKTVPVLDKLGIKTIGELAKFNRDVLIQKLGVLGGTIHDYANGRDNSPVLPFDHVREEKSIGKGTTFPQDISSFADLRKQVLHLADDVGLQMREKGIKSTTISVAIKSPDFKVTQRQRKISPTNLTKENTDIAMELVAEKWTDGKPIRAITITASNFTENEQMQMSFFEDNNDHERQKKLQEVVDKMNAKFGKGTLKLGG